MYEHENEVRYYHKKHKSRHHKRGGFGNIDTKAQSVGTPNPEALPPQPSNLLEQPRGGERINEITKKLYLTLGLVGVMVFSMSYNIHYTEFLSSYGRDFLGPLNFWYGLQLFSVFTSRFDNWINSKKPLAYYGAYAVAFEFTQNHFATLNPNYSGKFDPWDLVSAGAGTAFAIAVNKFITPKH